MDFLSKCEEIRSFLKEMFNGKFYFVIVHSTSLHFHFEQKKLYLSLRLFFNRAKTGTKVLNTPLNHLSFEALQSGQKKP